MKLSELKLHLNSTGEMSFRLTDGTYVPEHFHVTEIGLITKNFIDCGGTIRSEKLANLQLWNANDFDHRLKPEKLLKIMTISEKVLGNEDLEVEVEYQTDTIGKYGLMFNGKDFVLTPKQTACLAAEHCGMPQEIATAASAAGCCTSGSGCC